MRPRGAIRQALGAAALELAHAGIERFTWRDLLNRAPVVPGLVPRAAKTAHRDMVRAGELRIVDAQRQPHARRPMAVCELATRQTGAAEPALDGLMRAWSR